MAFIPSIRSQVRESQKQGFYADVQKSEETYTLSNPRLSMSRIFLNPIYKMAFPFLESVIFRSLTVSLPAFCDVCFLLTASR